MLKTGYYCNQNTPTFSYFVPLMCILILSSYIRSSLPTAPTFRFLTKILPNIYIFPCAILYSKVHQQAKSRTLGQEGVTGERPIKVGDVIMRRPLPFEWLFWILHSFCLKTASNICQHSRDEYTATYLKQKEIITSGHVAFIIAIRARYKHRFVTLRLYLAYCGYNAGCVQPDLQRQVKRITF